MRATLAGLALAGLLAAPAQASWELGRKAIAEGDFERAAGFFQRAAPAGDPRAQLGLGLLYLEGLGVEKDEERGARWIRRSARRGLLASQTVMGRLYISGTGVPQDDDEALKWYRKAASYGDSNAQASLGILYAAGRGVGRSPIHAATWLTLATDAGNEAARPYLERVRPTLTGTQVEVVQRRVDSFQKRSPRPVGEDPMDVAQDLFDDLGLEHWSLIQRLGGIGG